MPMQDARGKIPEALHDARPVVKLAYMYIETAGDTTIEDIQNGTELASRTVRGAVNELVERGYVTKEPDFDDLRRKRILFDRR